MRGHAWVRRVPAIVQGWYLGSESGNALAAVLMGDADPGGRLPFTFPARLEDVPAHQVGEYVGKPANDTVDVHYRERHFCGLSVGRPPSARTAAFPLWPWLELHHVCLWAPNGGYAAADG